MSNISKSLEEDKPRFYDLRYQFFAAVLCSINHIHLGIGMAFSTIMLSPQLFDEDFAADVFNASDLSAYSNSTSTDYLNVSKSQASWIASLVSISGVLTSILCGIFMERFGRKKSIILGAAINFIGWILTVASAGDLTILYLSRVIAGMGEGMISSGEVYLSELGHPAIRASLLSSLSCAIMLGIMLTSILGYFVTWKGVAIFSAVAGLLGLLGTFLLPESPIWIGLHVDDPKKSSTLLIGTAKWHCRNPEEFQKAASDNNTRSDEPNVAKDEKENALKPFIIMIVLFSLLHLTGSCIIVFYANQTFKAVGASVNVAWLFLILIGFLRGVGALICSLNYFQRRSLFLTSAGTMSLFAFFVTIWTYIFGPSLTSAIFALLHIGCSNFGMLPLPFALVGELLPNRSRGKLTGLLNAYSFLLMFAMTKIFIVVVDTVGIENVYLIFGIFSMISVIFVYFFVPETRGKTLDEIQVCLKSKTVRERSRKGARNVT